MATAEEQTETQRASDAERHRLLRSVESRWVLPMAAIWFVGVSILAWYGVVITRRGNAPDGRLTYREAAWLVQSERLVGLSLEEAQREIDGEIVATANDPPQPAVAVADRKGKMLVMELEAGRVKKVEIR